MGDEGRKTMDRMLNQIVSKALAGVSSPTRDLFQSLNDIVEAAEAEARRDPTNVAAILSFAESATEAAVSLHS